MSRTDGASLSHFLRASLTDTILEMVFWPSQSEYQSYLKQLRLLYLQVTTCILLFQQLTLKYRISEHTRLFDWIISHWRTVFMIIQNDVLFQCIMYCKGNFLLALIIIDLTAPGYKTEKKIKACSWNVFTNSESTNPRFFSRFFSFF